MLLESSTTAADQFQCSIYFLMILKRPDFIELPPLFICIGAFCQLIFNKCSPRSRTLKFLIQHQAVNVNH